MVTSPFARRIQIAATLAFALSLPICGETSDHQRIGVDRKTILEMSPSLGAKLSKELGYGEAALSAEAHGGLSILILRTISLDLDMPISVRLFSSRDATPRFVWAPGDASVLVGTSFRLADWRLGLAASYTHPLGVYAYYEAVAKRIASGAGYRTISGTLSATRYLDPLALGFQLHGETGLPREERFGISMRPFSLTLALFATEALNANAAITASIGQVFSLPLLVNGVPEVGGSSYSLSGSLGLVLSGPDSSFRIALSKRLSELTEPISLSLSFSPTFRIKEPK